MLLLSVQDLRNLLRGMADGTPDARLGQITRVADEVVESIVGPLGAGPWKASWVEAAGIIAEHLWDRSDSGGSPGTFGTTTDENGVYGRGFSIPKAARELLEASLGSRDSSAPQFAFPPASPDVLGSPYGYRGGYGYGYAGGW